MSISTIRRQVKNAAYNSSDAQVKVREATSNDPWGPSTALMSEIADLTHNPMAFTEIMSIVWKRLNDSGKNWRHVYKSLVLLDFLIKCGHEKVAQQCRENVFTIETLKDFQHVEDSRDQGLNIREKAKQITSLLSDDERLKNERTRFILTRNKFKQNNPGPVGAESRRSNRHNISDSALDSEYEEARPSTPTEKEMQLQIALTLSREECEKAEEMRKSDDARLQMAFEESNEEGSTLNSTDESISSTHRQDALHALLEFGVIEPVSTNTDSTASQITQESFNSSENSPSTIPTAPPPAAFSQNMVTPFTNEMYLVINRTKAVVKSTYKPRSADELGLRKGEHVYIVKKGANNFWKGQATNGCCGWFPSNCVMEIKAAVDAYQRSTNGIPANTEPGPSQTQAQTPSPSEQKESAISKKGPTSENMASLIADLQIGFRLPGTTPNIPVKTTPVTEEVAQEEEVTAGTILKKLPTAPTSAGSTGNGIPLQRNGVDRNSARPLQPQVLPANQAPKLSQPRQVRVPPPVNAAPSAPTPKSEELEFLQFAAKKCETATQPFVLRDLCIEFLVQNNSTTPYTTVGNWLTKYRINIHKMDLDAVTLARQVFLLKAPLHIDLRITLEKRGKIGFKIGGGRKKEPKLSHTIGQRMELSFSENKPIDSRMIALFFYYFSSR